MVLWKRFLVLAAAVSAVTASPEFTPYGAVQYRLRFEQGNHNDGGDAETQRSFDYSNRLCLRTGFRLKFDEQFSAEFRLGNDFGSAENVSWSSNRNPNNLYVHLAFFRWNPGPVFLEAGIVPLTGNGALDLMQASLWNGLDAGRSPAIANPPVNRYDAAIFDGWGDQNNSMAGIKFGVPINDAFGVEVFQSVIQPRTDAVARNAVTKEPSAVMTVLQLPIRAGTLRVTPEAVLIFNRRFETAEGSGESGDHEIAFGLAGSAGLSDDVSLSFRGAYAMYNNSNTRGDAPQTESMEGLLVGAGITVRNVGPGNIQFGADYNRTNNAEAVNDAVHNYVYTDLRYAVRVHPRMTITPRYRTYTRLWPGEDARTRFNNRFELIFDGSF